MGHLYLLPLIFFCVFLFEFEVLDKYRPQTLCRSALFYSRSLSVTRAGRKIRSLRARAQNRNDNAPRRGHRVNTTLPRIDFSTLHNPRSAPFSSRFRYKHALSVIQLQAKFTPTVVCCTEKCVSMIEKLSPLLRIYKVILP